jgi:hypothetical protein
MRRSVAALLELAGGPGKEIAAQQKQEAKIRHPKSRPETRTSAPARKVRMQQPIAALIGARELLTPCGEAAGSGEAF